MDKHLQYINYIIALHPKPSIIVRHVTSLWLRRHYPRPTVIPAAELAPNPPTLSYKAGGLAGWAAQSQTMIAHKLKVATGK